MLVECSECEFNYILSPRRLLYVIDDNQQRVLLGHPGEGFTIREVLGLDWQEAEAQGRIVRADASLCMDCCQFVDWDVKVDAPVCDQCNRNHIQRLAELSGHICPKCHLGTIGEVPVFKAELDPGWRNIEIPSIIQDLAITRRSWKVTDSLKNAELACESMNKYAFEGGVNEVIAILDDREWRCRSFSEKRHTYVVTILKATPQFEEILNFQSGKVSYRNDLPIDLRHGIRSYIRWHAPEGGCS
jgi:hypothetical protein